MMIGHDIGRATPRKQFAIRVLDRRRASAGADLEAACQADRDELLAEHVQDLLDLALEDSFPCSDPLSSMRAD
jgi:hypothetical protein